METLIGAAATGDQAADAIMDATDATFMQDVIEASMQTPVIVDFWAPWCGPCKQLGPAIEKVVKAARGAVRLVKVNIDENPMIAQQLRVQSIPTVFAFVGGRPVDAFQGALPESQIKSFVDNLIRAAGGAPGDSPIEAALEQARESLANGDHGTASAIFGQILGAEPDNLDALGGLGQCLVAAGDMDGARAVLEKVPEADREKPDFVAIRAALELGEQTANAGEIGGLQQRVSQDPDDHQARLDLANALYGAGDREAAIEALLEIVRRDREWNEQAGRKQLVKLFEAMGPTDPLTVSARRQLSSILFS